MIAASFGALFVAWILGVLSAVPIYLAWESIKTDKYRRDREER